MVPGKGRRKEAKQKRAASELASANQRLDDLARFPQENPNPILRVARDGTVIYANTACSPLLNVFECKPGKLLPDQYRKLVSEVLDTSSQQVIEIECQNRTFVLDFVPIVNAGYVNIYGRDMTERKKAKEALEESQRDLNHAQAVAHTGSWRLDVQRNELLWSDETHRIFGVPKGTPMTYETFLSYVHPDDREHVDNRWQAALQGEDYDIEHRIIVADEVKWVREKAELEFDQQGMFKGGFGTTQDITDRKKAEEALRYSHGYLNRILNGMFDAVMVIDRNYIIKDVNDRFIKLYRGSRDKIIERNCYVITHAASKPCSGAKHRCPLQEVIKTKSPASFEHKHISPDGDELTLEIAAFPILDITGEVDYIVEVQHDITERKKVEQLKDEFIGLVSHELRTPLTVITGALKTALDERISQEERRELLQDVVWGAESLATILDNLIELSRYQADRLKLNKKAASVREIADKAALAVGGQYPAHLISLDIPGELPPVTVDPGRLERILYNLMDNAGKYSPEGSEVRVFARQERKDVVIGVSDHGAGIAPEEQEGLFEPFARLGVEGKTKGVGLGLVVCKRLVEAHSGRIWVESKPGAGSTFLFSIPLGKGKRTRGRR